MAGLEDCCLALSDEMVISINLLLQGFFLKDADLDPHVAVVR